MQSIARSSLSWLSNVTQLPNDSRDTCKPLRPTRRYFIFLLSAMPATLRPPLLGDTQRPDAESHLPVGPLPERRGVRGEERARRADHRQPDEGGCDRRTDEAVVGAVDQLPRRHADGHHLPRPAGAVSVDVIQKSGLQ